MTAAVTTAAVNRPTSSALMQVLNDIETNFPVMRWRVGGIDIWPLVRLDWFFTVWNAGYRPTSAIPGAGRLQRLRSQVARLVRARLDRALMHGRQPQVDRDGRFDAVFLSDGISFASHSGKWFERFCDPLMTSLAQQGRSSLLLIPGHPYLNVEWKTSRFVQPELDIAKMLSLTRTADFMRSAELPQYDGVIRALAANGLDPSALEMRRLAANAARIGSVARQFERLFVRSRPHVAFVVSYYSIEGMAFILACRRCSIPVVDLQHGVQGLLHPAYGGFPRDTGRLELLPDWFWVWSDEEASAIRAWAGDQGAHRTVVGGNPWLGAWLRLSEGFAQEADRSIALMREEFGRDKVALVTLQPGLRSDEQLLPLTRLMRAAAGRWVWWVRLHPTMRSQREEIRSWLRSTGCRFDLDRASDMPLYGLLRHVDAHVTHSSSTVLEAEAFGVGSLVISAFGAELFPRQIERGICRFVAGPEERMIEEIDRLAQQRLPPAQLATDPTLTALNSLFGAAPTGVQVAA